MTESSKRPLRTQIAWILVVCGILSLVVSWLLGPSYDIAVTDFGRDLIGANLAQSGENPYREVAGLPPSAINGVVEGVDNGATWIAHSPVALALALIWLEVLPVQSLEPAALGVLVGALLLVGVITFQVTRSLEREVSLGILGAAALMMGVRSDLFWLQGSALVAVGLYATYWLDGRNRRGFALLFLAALVAWRPWLAPLAFFLPGGISPWKDAVKVGTAAIAFTLLSTAFLGGWDTLERWLTVALPANLDFYRTYEWNQSFLGPYLPPALTYAIHTTAILLAARFRRRIPSYTWPLVGALLILSLSPLVWSQYWLALIPCILLPVKHRADLAILVLLALVWPISEYSGSAARFSSYIAVLLAGWLLVSEIEESGGVVAGRSKANQLAI